jgi:hypothetical protein
MREEGSRDEPLEPFGITARLAAGAPSLCAPSAREPFDDCDPDVSTSGYLLHTAAAACKNPAEMQKSEYDTPQVMPVLNPSSTIANMPRGNFARRLDIEILEQLDERAAMSGNSASESRPDSLIGFACNAKRIN